MEAVTLLEVNHVTHTYETGDNKPVLKDVNLDLDTNEILAIVGESGCGKTTMGKIITGLVKASHGSIEFNGDEISRLKGRRRKTWRRSVQMVHQDPYGSLNPGLTIASTLAPGLLVHKLATRRTVQAEMLKALQQVGLDATPAFLQRYPHQLSGGQRQRVAIARAISLQPDLIVADEVTSMLDVSMRVAILDLLLSFQRERGIGYVFISHDFGVVRYFAQGGRIVVMFFGSVVEEGPVEELITAPKHPYTYMLLEAIPVPDPVIAQNRDTDEDKAERLINEPAVQGCPYANRCPFVEDKCRQSKPPLFDLGNGHRTACFFPEKVPELAHLSKESDNDDANPAGSQTPDPRRPGDADPGDRLPAPDSSGS